MPSREENVARQSFSSSVIVVAGNLASMFFLFVGSVVVIRLLGPADYGLYSLALTIPLFAQMLVGLGVRSAINRYAAYYLSRGEVILARRMTMNAIYFTLLTCAVLTALSVVFSGVISATLLDRPSLTLYVEVSSLLIFGQGLCNFQTSAFVGWKEPVQDAIWNIVQAVLKMALSIALILLGLGVIGALFGYVFASLFAGIFGIVVLYLVKLRNRPGEFPGSSSSGSSSFTEFTTDVKTMVGYGFNTYLGTIILYFSQQPVLTIILSYIATNAVIGYYSSAGNVTQALSTVSGALTPVFFTAFASLDGIGSNTGAAFKHAVKYVSYFMMPLVLFLFVTSGLVVEIVYGSAFSNTTYYLEFLMLSYVPYAFGYPVLIPFLNGTGNTKMYLFMNIVEAVATLFPAMVLIFLLKLGINGLLLSIVISNAAPTVFGLYVSDKYLHARADYASLFRTFFVTLLSSAFIIALSYFGLRGLSYVVAFPIELIVFLALYLTFMPLSGTIKMEDIDRLRMSSRGIRVLNRAMDTILNYESFLLDRMEKLRNN